MDQIKTIATERLENLLPVDKVLIAKKYRIHGWLLTSYQALALRAEMITDDEADQLGSRSTARLCRAREEFIKSNGDIYDRAAHMLMRIWQIFESELLELGECLDTDVGWA